MSYKTILACLPVEGNTDRILDVALPIARKHDAHFIGLHVTPRVPLMYGVVAAEIPKSVIAQQEGMLLRRADELKDAFYARCEKAGVKAEWRCNRLRLNDITSDLVSQSLCADLIVIGQEQEKDYGNPSDIPSRIALETGRPVLVVPYTGNFKTIGEHVVIAWNGSREAARAAFGAIPFMKNAKSVRVLAINPKRSDEYDSIVLGDEMALSLARHDIKAEVTVTRTDGITVGDELLNRMADDGCDLLVMGCFGHSRLRETLFGGVTINLLKHMTAPVLMSH